MCGGGSKIDSDKKNYFTISLPCMSECPAPQDTLQEKVNVPVLSAVNSTTVVSPGTSFLFTLKLIFFFRGYFCFFFFFTIFFNLNSPKKILPPFFPGAPAPGNSYWPIS